MDIKIGILIFLAIIVLLLLGISYVLLRKTSHPKFFTTEETIEIERSKGFLEGYDAIPKMDYMIDSYDGYRLGCTYVPLEGSHKLVIITHGHTYSRWGSVKYLMLFRKLGYGAVIYDDRGHGDNAKHPVTMGFHEAKDLLAVIADARNRFGDAAQEIGLHGESMGSAITLMALAHEQRLSFAVADCGYSDLQFFTRQFLKENFHLPSFFVTIASLMAKLLYGYSFKEVSPITAIKDNKVPICFIHGAADDFIDPVNGQRMYDAANCQKEIHLFEGAGHALSYQTDSDKYFEVLSNFIHSLEE